MGELSVPGPAGLFAGCVSLALVRLARVYWKYALEAIIKWLLLYFLNHDKGLLFML